MKKATAAVIVHENRVLLACRSKDGFWEFPGGKIESRETPEQCLIREIKEELDIQILVDQFLCKIEGCFRGQQMLLYAYVASWVSGEIKMNVHREVRWVDPCQLDAHSLIDEDQKIREVFLLKKAVK